jgi:hypothetical protein
MLLAIDAPHFYAGIELHRGRVAVAAPIVKWMLGMTLKEVERQCRRKRWKVTLVADDIQKAKSGNPQTHAQA